MAISWLKVETPTPDKPEVLEMASELNLDPDAVFGKVFRVWCWFDSHSEDGNAPSVTEVLLDRQVGVTGFVQSMINCGWMLKTDSGLSIPNFDNHNGESAKKRANTARRVAKSRNGNGKGSDNVTGEELHLALARQDKIRLELKDKREAFSDEWNFKLNPIGKPRFQKWSDPRKKHFKARCEEDQARDKNFWVDLVNDVPNHVAAMQGDWFNLEWLIKSENNLIKFLEGNYRKGFSGQSDSTSLDLDKLSNDELLTMCEKKNITTKGLWRKDLIAALEKK